MTRLARVIGASIVITSAWGCGRGSSPTAPSEPTGATSETVTSHLEMLLNLMQRDAAYTQKVEWTRVRAEVFATAAQATTIRGAYPAIEIALRALNDHGSHYQGSDGTLIGPSPVGGCTDAPSSPPPLPANIGYVRIDGCDCAGTAADEFATSLQQAIRAADRPGLAGWIVDLRGNLGGNMWPMIAGVGPVLGDGIIGWIVYNNREYEREYRNGESLSLGEAFARAANPYTLQQPLPRVAVLTNRAVASSGEAIVVYFRGRPGTRSFGTATCGHHHLLNSYPFANGATLVLTTSVHADRTKTEYAGPITPDEVVADSADAVQRAATWLVSGR